ncbi:hypothetical protein NE865_00750 [Phthorimaea operculella]|nr:hypothetical protein NE865_00750 [Phthorimaea operculella]
MEIGAVKQAFNNELILLKKNLNQAKIQIIHKLTRKAKELTEKKKVPEAIQEKFKKKAENAVKEVLILKKIKARDIGRFIVTHKGDWDVEDVDVKKIKAKKFSVEEENDDGDENISDNEDNDAHSDRSESNDQDMSEDQESHSEADSDDENSIEDESEFKLKIGENKTKGKEDKKQKESNKNKNLQDKIRKNKFKKDSDEIKEVEKVVDPFFVTATGENYMSVFEPRQPDEIKEVHKQGNRAYRRAVMFGNVPKHKPRPQFREDNFDRQNAYGKRPANKFDEQNGFSRNNNKFNKDDNNRFDDRKKPRFNDRNVKQQEEKPEKLHPSWEAKKKQSGILPFQGAVSASKFVCLLKFPSPNSGDKVVSFLALETLLATRGWILRRIPRAHDRTGLKSQLKIRPQVRIITYGENPLKMARID